MPRGTPRKLRIHDVLKRIVHGPYFSDMQKFGGIPMNEEQAHEQYQRWAESWVLYDLEELFPEVKRVLAEMNTEQSET